LRSRLGKGEVFAKGMRKDYKYYFFQDKVISYYSSRLGVSIYRNKQVGFNSPTI